MNISGPSNINK